MTTIEFFVEGIPKPGGSKTSIYSKKLGRVLTFDACKKNPEWRTAVELFARESYKGQPLTGPLRLTVTFVVQRPKSHSGKNGLLPKAPAFPITRPDATKLLRSTEDALTGILWIDDAQIVEQHVTKTYGDVPGAHIVVSNN